MCKGWRPCMIGATQSGDLIKLVMETDRSPVINIIRKVETAILHISISWIFLVKQTAVGRFRVLENIVCFFSFSLCAVICSSFPAHHMPDPLEEDNPRAFGAWWLRLSTVRILMVFHGKTTKQRLCLTGLHFRLQINVCPESLFVTFTTVGLVPLVNR